MDWPQALTTAGLGLVGGGVLLAFGKRLLDPLQQMRATIADVGRALIQYANATGSPGTIKEGISDKAAEDFRRLAAVLQRDIILIPCYRQTRWVYRLPTYGDAQEAIKQLIGLSNSLHTKGLHKDNANRAARICKRLRMQIPEIDQPWPSGDDSASK